jgi:crossover junction endodeoxyribonuclease RuvC
MLILGIDPGSVTTGYGLIEGKAGKLRHVDNGGIFLSSKSGLSERVCEIHNRIEDLIHRFSPDVLALEDIFIAKNVSSTLKLGHARGAVMVAAGRAGVPIFEYTALQVKQAVTGYGHAPKEQVQKMIRTLLSLPDLAFADASDALAVAICHSHSHRLLKKMGAA